MDIERANQFLKQTHSEIEGWFFPLDQLLFIELFVSQNQLRIAGDVSEVGVYHGKSFVLLSILKNENEKLIGFDLFDGDHQEKTLKNIEKYGVDSEISLLKGLTSDIAQADLDLTLSTPLRFLHIDAGHEYHEVLEQLLMFSPYMADRGIIAMDDYQDREFPGIEAAVLDFAEIDRPRRFVPFLAGGNKLFLCYEPMAATFQTVLSRRANFTGSCRLTRVKDFNVLIARSKLPVSSDIIEAQISSSNFPRRSDGDLSLHQKSEIFSQLTFGSGQIRSPEK